MGKTRSIPNRFRDASFSFASRLARENRWSQEYAERVNLEYKRFLYRVAKGNWEVTPSDQVWHLHLTYTRSYWQDLCVETLEMSLHHNPTKGGSFEQARFAEQYQQTLDIYAEEFGAGSPADIWPDTKALIDCVEDLFALTLAFPG